MMLALSYETSHIPLCCPRVIWPTCHEDSVCIQEVFARFLTPFSVLERYSELSLD